MNTLKESLNNALDLNFKSNRIDESNEYDAMFANRKFSYWTEKNFDDLVSNLISLDNVGKALVVIRAFKDAYASMLPEEMRDYIFAIGKHVNEFKNNPKKMRLYSYVFKDFLKDNHIKLEQMPDYSKPLERLSDKYAKDAEYDEFEDAISGNWGI